MESVPLFSRNDNSFDAEKRAESTGFIHQHEYESSSEESPSSTPTRPRSKKTLKRRAKAVLCLKLHQLSRLNIVAVLSIIRTILTFFVITIWNLRPRFMMKGGLKPKKKIHVTSYLDALRGYAALVVVNSHFAPFKKQPIAQQPFVSALVRGQGMVDLFFVISGYVLSYRLLKLLRTQQTSLLLNTFASSVFRRYSRLYGSAGVASFISMIVARQTKIHATGKVPRTTLLQQLWQWILDFIRFSNVFTSKVEGVWTPNNFSNGYLDVLWTIPVEFRGSIILYVYCLSVCKLSTRSRMFLTMSLVLLCFYWCEVCVSLFLGGMFLADLSYSRNPERLGVTTVLPQNTADTTDVVASSDTASSQVLVQERKQYFLEKIFFTVILLAALLLLGQPTGNLSRAYYPWPVLKKLLPSQYRHNIAYEHFWLSIGALLLVWALDSYPTLQRPLKFNISRYIGDLSFGIYVMHRPVMWSFGRQFLNPYRQHLVGNQNWALAGAYVIYVVVVIWVADLFIRIDTKVISAGRWVQEKLFIW